MFWRQCDNDPCDYLYNIDIWQAGNIFWIIDTLDDIARGVNDWHTGWYREGWMIDTLGDIEREVNDWHTGWYRARGEWLTYWVI